MELVLECSTNIYDMENIKQSQFNSVCLDLDTYFKIPTLEIKAIALKISDFNIELDKLKCQYLIVEPDKYNYDEYIDFGNKAIKNNKQILLVNNFINKNGQNIRGKFSNSTDIGIFIDKLNAELKSDVYGVCVDAVNCNLCALDIYEFIVKLKDKIKAVRISATSTMTYPLLFNRTSNIDWSGVIRGLREINFDSELIFDFSDNIKLLPSSLVNNILELVYEVGKHIEDRVHFEDRLKCYKHIVLFGAGFMGAVFMNLYGHKYPPLFICDNNKSLWGQNIQGVLVKSPEELSGFAKDAGVVICNSLYAKEIEAQLLEMGIKNIEIFD